MATLSSIRDRCLQRSNMQYDEGTDDADRFVTNVEVNDLINTGYRELYGHLIRHGMHRSESTLTITADGSATYQMESDFWAVLSVHAVDDSGHYTELRRHDHRHRPDTSWNSDAQTYRIVGSSIELSPIPLTGTYSVRYVPVPPTLSEDDDTIDGVLGWEEYVVLYVAMKLLQKEGSHDMANQLKPDMTLLLQRIQDESQAAELNETNVVMNSRWGNVTGTLPGDYAYAIRPRWWF